MVNLAGYNNEECFIDYLKKQIGEFLVFIIKSGSKCCKEKGVLCNIRNNVAIIITDNMKVEIPLEAIVAIKKRTEGFQNI